MIAKRTLFFCILIILNINLSGQEFYFKNIGTAQGLPSSETYHTLQDSQGFIWFTTDAGICKYDGKTIITYTTKDGLPENVVFNIYEDRHGRIWFSSMSGYLFYFENNSFHSIAANKELVKLCNKKIISSFFIGKNDTLFCSVYAFIFKLPPQNNYKTIVRIKSENYNVLAIANELNRREVITSFHDDSTQKITSNFSFYLYNDKKHFSLNANDFSNYANHISFIDDIRNIYLSFNKKIIIIPFKNEKIEYYDFSSEVIFMKQDKDQNLWVGTRKGAYFYKKSDLRSKPVYFLKNIAVADIMLDRENNIWVCSLRKGIYKSINKELLDFYTEEDDVCNFSKTDEDLSIGFTSKKEIQVDKNDSIAFLNISSKNIPASGTLKYLFKTDSSVYYGINNDLYYVKDKKKSAVEGSEIRKIENIPVKKIIQIGKDSIAVIGYMNLLIINRQGKLFSTTLPFIVKSAIQLKNKMVLIGSRNNEGIYQFNNNQFIPCFKGYPQLKTRINDMLEDSYGNLWIATNEKGLFCFSNNKLYEFNRIKGLSSNKINELDVDKKGNIWLATNVGIQKITISKGLGKAIIFSFNNSHGLPNLEIEHLAVFNNKVWCSAKEHLFYFDCDQMGSNTVPPFTYLKSVSINDSSMKVSDSPVLKYDQNNITFEFVGITFKNTEKKEFLYRLTGYENEWKSSATGECQYTNLPYGNYTFQVYSLNNDKIKSNIPATFNFSILRPFWFTWWFITLEIISLIIFVYMVIRWRVNKIEKREEEKTRINQKLAEFQMTAVRAQMNPHFVFNAINSIQHYILTNDKYNSYDYLAKFSHLIRNVLDNSQKEYISIEKEIITLSLYIELEKIRFDVPFEFILKVDEDLDQAETNIPSMVIQPYLENAIWHGLMPKQNDCLLELEIKKEGDLLQITIRDNGVGRGAFPKKKDHVSKGMGLMENRLKALSVKNNISFSVNVIDLKDEKETPCGTEVKISMPIISD